MAYPRLTFFCELEPEPLQDLFSEDIVADLVSINANLSLGILDLSPERASVVQRLNQANIPVIAWMLLPKEQGYWFNLYNAPQAVSRYAAFKAWASKYNLSFAGIGLDIEPDIRELAQFSTQRLKVLPGLFRRVLNHKAHREASQTYRDLVNQIRADGYLVESYQFPIIADERQSGSTFLQRMAGLVDINVDREVWMLYSSFLRPNGAGLIASYAPEAQAVGLGSTGGGVDIEFGSFEPLDWDELARDLRLSWHWCEDLYVFSLEGCVEKGFLEQLKQFTWDYPILMPHTSQARVDGWRRALRSSLWLTAHMKAILLGLVGVFLFWKSLSRFVKRKET